MSVDNVASDETVVLLDNKHSTARCLLLASGLALCITVDILQYSMPLAFLPSVLEDRGREPMEIASAIGVYYWTGFAGGACITSYQIYCLVSGAPQRTFETMEYEDAKRKVWYLIVGLSVGSITLLAQSFHPHLNMHISCRFLQGFAGAFIFFYSFLLSTEMFEAGWQRTLAVTMTSTALNVAEVLGSSLGAVLFEFWGQRGVFLVLGIVSVLNQIALGGMLYLLRPGRVATASEGHVDVCPQKGMFKLKNSLRNRSLQCAVILIFMAAGVKASVEEMLPFHADHRWDMKPRDIGILFAVTAAAYISFALLCGRMWDYLKPFRVTFSSFWLAILGITTWGVFRVIVYYRHVWALHTGLIMYGTCLALTHTPAALLLSDAIDSEEGKAREAVNGIWNTMWEAGGSLGFLLAGQLAHSYEGQVDLLLGYVVCCFLCAGVMMGIGPEDKPLTSARLSSPGRGSSKLNPDYGANGVAAMVLKSA